MPARQRRFDTALGGFVLRQPNGYDVLQINLRTEELLGQRDGSDTARAFATMLATLEVCVVEYPAGLTLADIYDVTLLTELYAEFLKWVESFRQPDAAPAAAPAGVG